MANSNGGSDSRGGELGDMDPAALNTFKENLAKLEEGDSSRSDKVSQRREIIAGLQESLDYLRLSVKYLIFDLEATRRENEYLRGLLEKRRNHDDSDCD